MSVRALLEAFTGHRTAPFVLAVAAVFYMFHNYLDIPFFRQVLQKRGVPPGAALEIRAVLLQRSGGVVLLGILVPTYVFMGRSPGLLFYYPEMRILQRGSWTPSLVLLNTASWAIYLVAYELLFRTMVAAGGELLAARDWGVWGTVRTTTSGLR